MIRGINDTDGIRPEERNVPLTDGMKNGREEGWNDGMKDGWNEGWNDAMKDGRTDGKKDGMKDGM